MLPEQGQFPLARLIVAQDIPPAIVSLHPKVPVIGGEPSIDNFHYLDAPIAKVQGARFFFATMAGVTLHGKLHGRLLGNRDAADLPVGAGGVPPSRQVAARILPWWCE
jgi:hypothetical protein